MAFVASIEIELQLLNVRQSLEYTASKFACSDIDDFANTASLDDDVEIRK
jgi:hypothetical protein